MEGDGDEARHRQSGGNGGGLAEQIEHGEDNGHEQRRHQRQRHQSHGAAHQNGEPQQRLTQRHDFVLGLALADGLAHDDRRGGAHAEAHHQEQPVQIAHDGVGRQHLHGVVGVAQDDRQQGVAQAPGGLVQHHRGGVFQKAAHHVRPRPQETAQVQGDVPAADGADHADDKLAHPGQQRGHGRTLDAQGGETAVSEDQQIVQHGIQYRGKAEQLHAEGGVLHAALGAGVEGGEHVEHVGEADDLKVRRSQQAQVVAVGQQVHHLHREQGEHHRQHGGDADAQEAGHAQGAVDVFQVALAPVLAHQNAQAALEPEHDADEQKYRHVGGGDGGHLLVAQLADHKGVDEP